LNDALVEVRGNGKRKIAYFADPNCGYCKRFDKSIEGLKDVTIYTFLYPILAPDSLDKSVNVWCSKDRNKAWHDWMLLGKTPTKADANCVNPIANNQALGQRLRVTGTPTLVFADGKRVGGAIPAEQVEQYLNQALAAK
jgi:thiol:disulfide interchange protein DsbC